MGARRPLISAVVAIAVVSTVALVAAAGSASPSQAPSQPTAVELSVQVGQVSFSSMTPQNLPVYAFGWSGRRTIGTTGGGGGTGKETLGDFSFTRQLDESSPLFLNLFMTGKLTKTVTVNVFQPGSQQVALKYTLSDVLISSFHHGAVGEADYTFPTDQVTLHFSKVCLQSFSPAGGTRASSVCQKIIPT